MPSHLNYSPKLKAIVKEIKKILDKNNVAGLIMLHEPGHSEYFMKLDPTYSRLKVDPGTGMMRLRSKLKEDYNGDKIKQQKELEATANMTRLLNIQCENMYDMISQIDDIVSDQLGTEETDGPGWTHGNPQDN